MKRRSKKQWIEPTIRISGLVHTITDPIELRDRTVGPVEGAQWCSAYVERLGSPRREPDACPLVRDHEGDHWRASAELIAELPWPLEVR